MLFIKYHIGKYNNFYGWDYLLIHLLLYNIKLGTVAFGSIFVAFLDALRVTFEFMHNII